MVVVVADRYLRGAVGRRAASVSQYRGNERLTDPAPLGKLFGLHRFAASQRCPGRCFLAYC